MESGNIIWKTVIKKFLFCIVKVEMVLDFDRFGVPKNNDDVKSLTTCLKIKMI